jgi:diguanylate cyclase (GGDEF)-like protein
MATTDAITGVGNRQRVMGELVSAVETAQTHGAWLAICMMDIDHFKAVNDTYGHPSGDEVLTHVAQRVRAGLREDETVGRYGGEEFIILMPRRDLQEAAERAEELRRLVEETPVGRPDGSTIAVTASFGVTATYGAKCRVDAMLLAVDRAMYQAKTDGRNAVRSVSG